jgi:hypothetical protein
MEPATSSEDLTRSEIFFLVVALTYQFISIILIVIQGLYFLSEPTIVKLIVFVALAIKTFACYKCCEKCDSDCIPSRATTVLA